MRHIEIHDENGIVASIGLGKNMAVHIAPYVQRLMEDAGGNLQEDAQTIDDLLSDAESAEEERRTLRLRNTLLERRNADLEIAEGNRRSAIAIQALTGPPVSPPGDIGDVDGSQPDATVVANPVELETPIERLWAASAELSGTLSKTLFACKSYFAGDLVEPKGPATFFGSVEELAKMRGVSAKTARRHLAKLGCFITLRAWSNAGTRFELHGPLLEVVDALRGNRQ